MKKMSEDFDWISSLEFHLEAVAKSINNVGALSGSLAILMYTLGGAVKECEGGFHCAKPHKKHGATPKYFRDEK